jgi:hypothetical protein
MSTHKRHHLTRAYKTWIHASVSSSESKTIYIVAHTLKHAKDIAHRKYPTHVWNMSHVILWVKEDNNIDKLPAGTIITCKKDEYTS